MQFKHANCASMTNVHMNGDYDFWYGIKAVSGKIVTLEKNGKNFDAVIKKDATGREYFMVEHRGIYSQLFTRRAERIKCVPFLDVSGEFKHIHPIEKETEPEQRPKIKPSRIPNKNLTEEEREYHSKQLVKIADQMESFSDDPGIMRELRQDYKFHMNELFVEPPVA